MNFPPRKAGESEYRVSFDKETSIATVTLFAKDEKHARQVFKTYVGKYDIRNIVKR